MSLPRPDYGSDFISYTIQMEPGAIQRLAKKMDEYVSLKIRPIPEWQLTLDTADYSVTLDQCGGIRL